MENIERQVKGYIESRFPRASKREVNKITNDWCRKASMSQGVFEDFKKRVGDPSGKKVLELGHGNGILLVPFAKAGANAYGLEIDPMLVDIAKENNDLYGVDMDLRLYDGRNFPFEDNFFDYIYATSVLEHVDDLVRIMEETDRVLKPGGRFYISFPNSLWPRDTHTGVLFLNYAPKWLVPIMLKFFGRSTREDWGLQFITFWSLKRAIRESGSRFYVLEETNSKIPYRSFIKKVFARMGVHYTAIFRTVMVVLEKEK